MRKQKREMLTLAEIILLNHKTQPTHTATLPSGRIVEVEISDGIRQSLEKRGWTFERIER